MAGEKKFTVGQEVWLIQDLRPPQLVPVVKVGRTLVTVERFCGDQQFRIDTGVANGTVYAWADRIRTQDEQAQHERRERAEKALRAAHIEPRRGYARGFDTDTLEALALVAADHPAGTLPDDVAAAIATLKAYRPETKETPHVP